jgi:hypothetical protein
MPTITRLEIKSFRGIRELVIDVPPEGAVISGGNARGKSSVLKAISAALAGQGIGPDAIRLGADQAEILVDLDAIKVRRSITAKGASLTVKNNDGDQWSKPQTRLNELFGTAALDALSFFLAEPKERRRMVMEALPVVVTAEDVARWAPGATKILQRVSLEGHGLEVLERLHQAFYEVRTEVNKAAKAARAEANAAANYPPAPDVAPTIEAAAQANVDAGNRFMQLQGRDAAAAEAKKGAQRTRALIVDAETGAADHRELAKRAPADHQLEAARALQVDAEREVQRIEKLLAAARAALQVAEAALDELVDAQVEATRHAKLAEEQERRAAELRGSLAEVEAMGVPAEEMAAARAELDRTVAVLEDAKAAARAAECAEDHRRMEALAVKREKDAAEIDAIVRRLATEAPQELAQRSAMIPGLGVSGDTITLDGVAIDSLSGAEQMRFAVDLCKRLNDKARILVVDGLERLDEDALETFVETATAGGWQLIGSRVSKGELVVEALQPAGKAAA